MPARSRRAPARVGGEALAAESIDAFLRAMPALLSHRGRPYSPETVRNYRDHLLPLAAWLADRPLSSHRAQLQH